MGIVNGKDFQIVYSDTPGILKPGYGLQEFMRKYSRSALTDSDIIIYVTDVLEKTTIDEEFLKRMKTARIPVLFIINKIDLGTEQLVKQLAENYSGILPGAEILPVSALEGFNIDTLFNRILDLLPDSPAYYPKDAFTDKSERFFVAEIIREKILLNYHKEIPYAVEIEVESFKESEKIIHIRSIIYVARDSQKGILIGHKGSMLKKTGTQARLDIEKFFNKKVFLELYVKVKKEWRNDPGQLKKFGYR